MKITIELHPSDQPDSPACFVPGQSIEGRVRWEEAAVDCKIEVTLLFEAVGAGKPQREVYATIDLEGLPSVGERPFAFSAPNWPWSFTGKLIQLEWKIAAVSADADTQLSIVVSPSRGALDLYAYPPQCEPLDRNWISAARR